MNVITLGCKVRLRDTYLQLVQDMGKMSQDQEAKKRYEDYVVGLMPLMGRVTRIRPELLTYEVTFRENESPLTVDHDHIKFVAE